MTFINKILMLVSFVLLSSFKFPNEKLYLSRKVTNITVFDTRGNQLEFFSLLGNKALILSPVYTRCPSLCGIISNGVKEAVANLGTLGKDFTMVSFSFDSTDRSKNLADYENRWDMDGKNWKTISASPKNIQLLMSSIDFTYDFNPVTKEFDHPSILIILTPSGRISRYIYGINPSAKDIKLAIIEANAEKTRPGIINGFYLSCFAFDPISKTYKLDWGFIISTFAGLLIMGCVFGIFIRSFMFSKVVG